MSTPNRVFRDRYAHVFHVFLTPYEGPRGYTARLVALVFETEDGAWIGSVPADPMIALEELSEGDLENLLEEALSTGWD